MEHNSFWEVNRHSASPSHLTTGGQSVSPSLVSIPF